MAPTTNAMKPTAQRAKMKRTQPATTTWNAVTIESCEAAAASVYFRIVRACRSIHRVRGILRVVLSVPAPPTGVLLTDSLKPQCSHSIQMRTER
jgi:hypothetical protein